MSKPGTPSQADLLRLGPTVANVKASTKPKTWKAFVKSTHAQGYTVAGGLSGAPQALRERTNASLAKEAQSSVAKAYAPAYADLNTQTSRLKAWDAKRATDNAAYSAWLASENDKLNAAQTTAQTLAATRAQQAQNDTASAWGAVQQAALQHAAASSGNVSNPAQSNALDLSAAADASNQRAAADRGYTDAMVNAAQTAAPLTDKAILGQQAAAEATRQGDFSKTLNDLVDARSKTQVQQSGDYLKEYSRLTGLEVDKASKLQDFNAISDKLGLARDTLNAKTLNDNRNYNLNRDKLDLSNWEVKHKASVDKAKIQLGYDQIASREGVDAANRKLKTYLAKKYHLTNGTKVTAGEKAASSKAIQGVDTVLGVLKDLHTRFPGPQGVTKGGQGFRQYLRGKGFSDDQIDVAEDLRKHNGKLSPRGRQKARKALGVTNPEQVWGVA